LDFIIRRLLLPLLAGSGTTTGFILGIRAQKTVCQVAGLTAVQAQDAETRPAPQKNNAGIFLQMDILEWDYIHFWKFLRDWGRLAIIKGTKLITGVFSERL
jgi:hypothetical protein